MGLWPKHNMAQVTMTFDSYEDRMELRRVLKSEQMALALLDMRNYLRGRVKYAPEDMPDGIFDELVKVQDIFQDVLDEYDVNIEDILE